MHAEREAGRRSWRTNMLLTAGVMVTVLLALMLAQLDALQARAELQRTGLPIVNIQATAIAVGQVIPLSLDPAGPRPTVAPLDLGSAPDDLNPRPEFITGVSEEGVIFTVCGEVPEGWLLYTVQPGETLASLAAGTESTAAELAGANCLTDGELTAGIQLLVPRQPVASLCGPPQWWVRYQVRSGDTLGALAANRGTTVDEILRANCRDSLDLQAGQLLFLPPGGEPGAAAPIAQPSLTPLPTEPAAPAPTSVPPTATNNPPPPTEPPPAPTVPPPPTEPPPQPTASPPPLPTEPPATLTPQPPPTEPPPTEAPPTEPAPTEPPQSEPPTPEPPPTEPPTQSVGG